MSIMEDNGTEIIRVGTINAWAFKIAIWIAPLFSLWLVTKVLAHDTDIAVLKMQMSMSGGKGISQSVNVGQHDKAAAAAAAEASAKTWLTTKDVAAREGITERTVINYIENGMIEPTPRKNGKSWEIAANFRIIPNDSENCGEIPQGP